MGELVDAFKKARPEILDFATRPVRQNSSPKRKLDATEDASSPVQKRTRSGRRIQSSSEVIVPDDFEQADNDSVEGKLYSRCLLLVSKVFDR